MAPPSSSVPRCPDCEHPAPERFCPNCGQRQGPLHVSVRGLFGEWLDELLHFDSKLVHTVGPLLFKPGLLTLEYVRGRRTRYVTPFRLWLAITVAFFVLVSVLPTGAATGQVQVEHTHGAAPTARGPITISFTDDDGPDAKPAAPGHAASADTPMGRLQRSFDAHLDRFKAEDPKAFSKRLQATSANYGPHLMLLLVPLFALVLKLFYWRAPLGEHFVFAFHLNAFHGGVGMAVMLLECSAAIRTHVRILPLLPIALLFVYVPVAIRRVHHQSVLRTVLKAMSLSIGYVMCWALLQVGFVFLAVMAS